MLRTIRDTTPTTANTCIRYGAIQPASSSIPSTPAPSSLITAAHSKRFLNHGDNKDLCLVQSHRVQGPGPCTNDELLHCRISGVTAYDGMALSTKYQFRNLQARLRSLLATSVHEKGEWCLQRLIQLPIPAHGFPYFPHVTTFHLMSAVVDDKLRYETKRTVQVPFKESLGHFKPLLLL